LTLAKNTDTEDEIINCQR